MNKFKREKLINVYREAQQEMTVKNLLELFDNNSVKAIPVKGYFMKRLYPLPDMRTMCDVDILVREECLEMAEDIMKKLDFPSREESENEIVYKRPPAISIELHKTLFKRSSNELFFDYYKDIWNRAVLIEGYNNIYNFNKEDFYIFMVAHLAKHYGNGEATIRNILDIYIYLQHYDNSLDKGYLEREFNKLKLNKFRINIEHLANSWFGDLVHTDYDMKISEFILHSSMYGDNKARNAAMAVSTGGRNVFTAKIRRFQKVCFPTYTAMKSMYPVLRSVPVLLPIYWIWRLIDRLLLKHRNVKGIIKVDVKQKDIDTVQKHFSEIGLIN